MASLTIKHLPDELLEELRSAADRERRSINQQAIVILEQALARHRHSFLARLEAFYDEAGPPTEGGSEWDHVRSDDPGREPDV